MNLNERSQENVDYMVDVIVNKLKMINLEAIKHSGYDENMYEELKDIYDFVIKKETFSPSEMQLIVEEIGQLRKK